MIERRPDPVVGELGVDDVRQRARHEAQQGGVVEDRHRELAPHREEAHRLRDAFRDPLVDAAVPAGGELRGDQRGRAAGRRWPGRCRGTRRPGRRPPSSAPSEGSPPSWSSSWPGPPTRCRRPRVRACGHSPRRRPGVGCVMRAHGGGLRLRGGAAGGAAEVPVGVGTPCSGHRDQLPSRRCGCLITLAAGDRAESLACTRVTRRPLGHDGEPVVGGVQPAPAVRGDGDDVLDPYAEAPAEVDPGLDGEAHPRHRAAGARPRPCRAARGWSRRCRGRCGG